MSSADRDKWDERYRAGAYAGRTWPSELLSRWIDRLPAGRALDLACGAGRNALFLACHRYRVKAVDISAEALQRPSEAAAAAGPDHGLMARLPTLLAPGGILLCEQHLVSDAPVAGPSSPRFRLQPGELAGLTTGLETLERFEGVTIDPDGAQVALTRIVAQRQAEK